MDPLQNPLSISSTAEWTDLSCLHNIPNDAVEIDTGTTTTTLFSLVESNDGVHWSPIITDLQVAFGVGWSSSLSRWVVTGEVGASNFIFVSSDGLTWVSVFSPSSTPGQVEWAADIGQWLIVLGSSSISFVYSFDGENWFSASGDTLSANFESGIIRAPELGLWICTADSSGGGFYGIQTSPNGVFWTARSLPGLLTSSTDTVPAWSPLLGLAVAASVFGSSEPLVKSTDGITWTNGATGIGGPIRWIDFLGIFVAQIPLTGFGGATGILISSDGLVWSHVASPLDSNCNGIIAFADNGSQVLVMALDGAGASGRFLISTNGIDWTEISLPGKFNGSQAAWSSTQGKWIMAGSGGIENTTEGTGVKTSTFCDTPGTFVLPTVHNTDPGSTSSFEPM